MIYFSFIMHHAPFRASNDYYYYYSYKLMNVINWNLRNDTHYFMHVHNRIVHFCFWPYESLWRLFDLIFSCKAFIYSFQAHQICSNNKRMHFQKNLLWVIRDPQWWNLMFKQMFFLSQWFHSTFKASTLI